MTPDEDIDLQRREAGIGEPLAMLEPAEKTMMGEAPPGASGSRPQGAGSGKPHYTRLLLYEDMAVFAAGCCKPLTVLRAEMDGLPIEAEIILSRHSEESGGKLLYGINAKGNRLVIDLRRGDSARFQRLAFVI